MIDQAIVSTMKTEVDKDAQDKYFVLPSHQYDEIRDFVEDKASQQLIADLVYDIDPTLVEGAGAEYVSTSLVVKMEKNDEKRSGWNRFIRSWIL